MVAKKKKNDGWKPYEWPLDDGSKYYYRSLIPTHMELTIETKGNKHRIAVFMGDDSVFEKTVTGTLDKAKKVVEDAARAYLTKAIKSI